MALGPGPYLGIQLQGYLPLAILGFEVISRSALCATLSPSHKAMSSDGSSGALDAAPGCTSGLSSISEYRAHDTSASGFSSETGADEITLDAAHAAVVSEMGYDNPDLEATLAAHGLDRSKPGEGPRPVVAQVVPDGQAAKGSLPAVREALPLGQASPPPAAPPPLC